jgi:hypothetical protein
MDMRKLDARWDVDVPRPDLDEGDPLEPDRVHFGIRLGRGRHQGNDMSSPDRDPALVESVGRTSNEA